MFTDLFEIVNFDLSHPVFSKFQSGYKVCVSFGKGSSFFFFAKLRKESDLFTLVAQATFILLDFSVQTFSLDKTANTKLLLQNLGVWLHLLM